MKILHLYKDYFPVVGGIENHIKILAEHQAAQGHDVTVLVTSLNRQPRIENRNGVRVMYAARRFDLSSAPFSGEMFQRVARLETDITHLHAPYPFGELANYFFGHTRATILTYHSDIVRQRVMGALYTPFLHRVLKRAQTIIATSPNYIESSPVLEKWRAKCVVVPLASSLPTQTQLASLPNPNSELLFVGRLRYYKGVNYLLEALGFLPNARLTIIGTGPMEHAWKNLARELNIEARVSWVGEVSADELAAYYQACEIFVLPCSERSEAFGAVQLEAMAHGKPIVSCDVRTGVAWVNQNEITGIVVPPKNPRALAVALERLRQDAALRAKMGGAGKARVEAEFTVKKMVERVMKVYTNALAQK